MRTAVLLAVLAALGLLATLHHAVGVEVRLAATQDTLAAERVVSAQHEAAADHMRALYIAAAQEVRVCEMPAPERAALVRLLDALPAIVAAYLGGRE